MAPTEAAAVPQPEASSQKNIAGILLGPPGSGKGTQVPSINILNYILR